MTLAVAKQMASDEAVRTHQAHVVWRMPAWRPKEAYAVFPIMRGLPPNGQTVYVAHAPTSGTLFDL